MKPEELEQITGAVGEAVGEKVKEHFDSFRDNEFAPMREDVTEIRRVQGLHGERIKGVETRLNGTGDCTMHAEKVTKATEQAKSALKNTDKNWTFIRVLIVAAITALLGATGSLLAWALGRG